MAKRTVRRKADQTRHVGNNTTPGQPRSNSGPASAGIIGGNMTNPGVATGRPATHADRSLHNGVEAKFRNLKNK